MFETLTTALQAFSQRLFKSKTITEKDFEGMIQQMRDTLLAADVPQTIIAGILDGIKSRMVGQTLEKNAKAAEQISHALFQEIQALLGQNNEPFSVSSPCIIMMVGLQGSGKTTSLAKLAHRLKREQPKRRIMVASLDFYRPAARDQLNKLAQKIGVDYYATSSLRASQAAGEVMECQASKKYDVVLVDTAGRMNTDSALLEELRVISNIIHPNYTLLVLDAMTGQASLNVAQEFNRTVELSGGILTKTDSGARAGVALAFRKIIDKPLLFTGTGEAVDDFEPFVPQRLMQRLLGEGDIASLSERAQARISEENRKKTEEALMKDSMSLEDFSHYLRAMASLGSLTSLTRYLPAGMGFSITDKQAKQKERDMVLFTAIINAMTKKERLNPKILSTPRRRRVARGAGVSAAKVDELLITFEEMRGYVKLMKSMTKSSAYPSTMKRK